MSFLSSSKLLFAGVDEGVVVEGVLAGADAGAAGVVAGAAGSAAMIILYLVIIFDSVFLGWPPTKSDAGAKVLRLFTKSLLSCRL